MAGRRNLCDISKMVSRKVKGALGAERPRLGFQRWYPNCQDGMSPPGLSIPTCKVARA